MVRVSPVPPACSQSPPALCPGSQSRLLGREGTREPLTAGAGLRVSFIISMPELRQAFPPTSSTSPSCLHHDNTHSAGPQRPTVGVQGIQRDPGNRRQKDAEIEPNRSGLKSQLRPLGACLGQVIPLLCISASSSVTEGTSWPTVAGAWPSTVHTQKWDSPVSWKLIVASQCQLQNRNTVKALHGLSRVRESVSKKKFTLGLEG